jgi:hypothetical protein
MADLGIETIATNDKIKSDKTLMGYTKQQLIEFIRILEHNNESMKITLEMQYRNCIKIFEDMNLFNETYENRNIKSENGKSNKIEDVGKFIDEWKQIQKK